MGMPAAKRERWTRAEVEQLIADNPLVTPRYELVDGELFVTPSPVPPHQIIVAELYAALREYVRASTLGRVYFSPSDIELEAESYVQPDLYVVPPEQDRRLRVERKATTLSLAIEVLSPSSARGDRGRKRLLYQRHVPEYWIVDIDARLVERWRTTDDRPEIVRQELIWAPAPNLPPLVIDLDAVFAELSDDDDDDEG
jgi:Uma2 family endonuclease